MNNKPRLYSITPKVSRLRMNMKGRGDTNWITLSVFEDGIELLFADEKKEFFSWTQVDGIRGGFYEGYKGPFVTTSLANLLVGQKCSLDLTISGKQYVWESDFSNGVTDAFSFISSKLHQIKRVEYQERLAKGEWLLVQKGLGSREVFIGNRGLKYGNNIIHWPEIEKIDIDGQTIRLYPHQKAPLYKALFAFKWSFATHNLGINSPRMINGPTVLEIIHDKIT